MSTDRYDDGPDDDDPCVYVEHLTPTGDVSRQYTLSWRLTERRLSEALRELIAQVAVAEVTLRLADGSVRRYRRHESRSS